MKFKVGDIISNGSIEWEIINTVLDIYDQENYVVYNNFLCPNRDNPQVISCEVIDEEYHKIRTAIKVNKKEKIQYYVACKKDDENKWLWTCRHNKKPKSSRWQKLDKKQDNIEEIIKTKQYTCECYPDNDSCHFSHTFNIDIKTITTLTEIYEF